MRSASQEELLYLQKNGLKVHPIYSYFPCDHWDCTCQDGIKSIKVKMSEMTPAQLEKFKADFPVFKCSRQYKAGFKRYKIFCKNCNALVVECSATSERLEVYCDAHYICESVLLVKRWTTMEKVESERTVGKGKNAKKIIVVEEKPIKHSEEYAEWRGAMAINISPIDGTLGIECSCGADTRDFRGNLTLPSAVRESKIRQSMRMRGFGRSNSAFEVKLHDKQYARS